MLSILKLPNQFFAMKVLPTFPDGSFLGFLYRFNSEFYTILALFCSAPRQRRTHWKQYDFEILPLDDLGFLGTNLRTHDLAIFVANLSRLRFRRGRVTAGELVMTKQRLHVGTTMCAYFFETLNLAVSMVNFFLDVFNFLITAYVHQRSSQHPTANCAIVFYATAVVRERSWRWNNAVKINKLTIATSITKTEGWQFKSGK